MYDLLIYLGQINYWPLKSWLDEDVTFFLWSILILHEILFYAVEQKQY